MEDEKMEKSGRKNYITERLLRIARNRHILHMPIE